MSRDEPFDITGYAPFSDICPGCENSVWPPAADAPIYTICSWQCPPDCNESWSIDVHEVEPLPCELFDCDVCGRDYAFDGTQILVRERRVA